MGITQEERIALRKQLMGFDPCIRINQEESHEKVSINDSKQYAEVPKHTPKRPFWESKKFETPGGTKPSLSFKWGERMGQGTNTNIFEEDTRLFKEDGGLKPITEEIKREQTEIKKTSQGYVIL